MTPVKRKIQRLLVLFFLGCLAFNYPLLALFSKRILWAGLPLLFLYLFIFWFFFIGLIAMVAEKKQLPKTSLPPPTRLRDSD
jgi:predicted permease